MKRCLCCDARYSSSIQNCPSCSSDIKLIDGFDSYAPDFAHEGGGFKSSSFSDLALLEDANFWFRSRNKLLMWAIEKYCPNFQSLLEIGCGTGYVLSGISKKFPHSNLFGSEIFTTGLNFAAERLPLVKLMQMDARNIPYIEEFDVIGAFDVLEHIEEDEHVLSQIHTALNPGGHVILTVPQHAWLWSAVDEYSCHARRYSITDLRNKFERAGFSIVRTTSFVTTLLPFMAVSRMRSRNQSTETIDPTKEFKIPSLINTLFYKLLRAECCLIKAGINFPVGGSRLVIAQKK
jgi:SAM-dependent methyltransferase